MNGTGSMKLYQALRKIWRRVIDRANADQHDPETRARSGEAFVESESTPDTPMLEATNPAGSGRQESQGQASFPDSQRATLQDIQQLNAGIVDELVLLLNERRPILFAGAGCSVDLGYPGWAALVESMRAELAPTLQLGADLDIKTAAEIVKLKCIEQHGSSQAFARFIRNSFAPKTTNSGPFQSRLVRLGFGGLVTTNYDVNRPGIAGDLIS